MIEELYYEVGDNCKIIVLHVIREFRVTEDAILEDEQWNDRENWKSKFTSSFDEGVFESKDIERKAMLENMRIMRRNIRILNLSFNFLSAFCLKSLTSQKIYC